MDFIPHTPADDAEMLARIGAGSLDELFEPVPAGLRFEGALEVPASLDEPTLSRHLGQLASRNEGATLTCFAGGGSYDHYVPAAVRALAGRAEFATSYTPYQPELSQGVLQALFEFQTVVCELYGMEAANASLYDGANALVEAVNLAVRVTGRERVVVASSVHPHYRAVLRTYTSGQGLEIVEAGFGADGRVDAGTLDPAGAAAVVLASPNFFGVIEDAAPVYAAARDAGALAVAVADPTAMGVLESPGALGADVVVGEGQAFGNPISYGGPYVGLFATRLAHVRQVPGRIAGETVDADGRRAFVLTLQAREQHIRRAKATSNVCTNQTLMAIAATVHLCWLGPEGLARLGQICARRAAAAARALAAVPGCEIAFEAPHFKEFVLRTPLPAEELIAGLARRGVLVGPGLGRYYEGMDNCVTVAVTEKRTPGDIDALVEAVHKEVADR